MSDYITDPELLKKLNGEAPEPETKKSKKSEYVTDPVLLERLNAPADEDKQVEEALVMGAGAAAPWALPAAARVAAATPGAVSSAYQMGKTAVGPTASGAIQAAKGLGGSYLRNPGGIAADVLASKMGLPPPVASQQVQPLYEGLNKSYQSVKDWITQQTAPKPAAPTGPAPNEVQRGAAIAGQLTPEEAARVYSSPNPQAAAEEILAQRGAKPAGSFMSKAAPYLEGAGKALMGAQIAKELFYTSPEEIAILKQAEAKRKAQQTLQQAPTEQNFFERIKALGTLYGN